MKSLPNTPETVIRYPVTSSCTVRTLGHICYNTPWKHFPRRTNEYILYLVESGDLYIEEDGMRYHLEKNSTLLLEPGKLHVGYKHACVSYFYIHFSCNAPLMPTALTDELKEQIHKLRITLLESEWDYLYEPSPYDTVDLYFPKKAPLGGSYSYFQTLREMDKIFFEGLEGRRTLVSLKLQEMLTMLCREFSYYCINPNYTKALTLVRDIRIFINNNYASAITSQSISEEFHIHYDYANRQFKQYVGQSIHNYLIAARIYRAKRLLSSGTPINESARLVGIDDTAYFSRIFKKSTGMSPSEYAKRTYHSSREQK